MAASRTVRIDMLPESAWRYSGYDAIVCVDVLLSATTIVTALGQGRRVVAPRDDSRVSELAESTSRPKLVTDGLSGPAPRGVSVAGPASLAGDAILSQPVVHVSPFGEMLAAAAQRARAYVACLRNIEATANELVLQHRRVVLIGAGQDGSVCAADQMAAAWLALRLQGRGFELEGRHTTDEVGRWGAADVGLIDLSRSAERLRTHGRGREVEFVLRHVNDLNVVCRYDAEELIDPVARRRRLEEDSATPAWGTPRPPASLDRS